MEKKIEFEEIVDKNFNGCISVVKNGAVIFQKNYGYADLSNEICNEIAQNLLLRQQEKFLLLLLFYN